MLGIALLQLEFSLLRCGTEVIRFQTQKTIIAVSEFSVLSHFLCREEITVSDRPT